ncbi:MAG: F0F1 ATP synthase subunit A [Bradymonadia bacterium]
MADAQHIIPGEHGHTWMSLPFNGLEKQLAEAAGDSFLFGQKVTDVHHVSVGIVVFFILVFAAMRFSGALKKDASGGVIPESRFNLRSVFESILDYVLATMTGIMGEKAARYFLPFIGTFAFFILISNLIGLVPGFLPPTDSFNTTVPCAMLVFFATHIYGLKENGMEHIKHMMGPVWWLAPLIFVIEFIGHLARPVSLSLRLAGNMIGDHKAVSIFLMLVPLGVPVALLGLGFIVCLVQTLVFCLLSVVYIGMAIEHHDHGEAH